MMRTLRKSRLLCLTGVASLCLLPGGIAYADAADVPSLDSEEVASLVNDADPHDVAPVDVPAGTTDGEAFVVDSVDGSQVTRVEKSGEVVMSSGQRDGDADLSIALVDAAVVSSPEVAADGTVVFDGDEQQRAPFAVQVLDDGSVQVHAIIESSSDAMSFDYRISSPDTGGVELVAEEDGSVSIFDADGEWLGGVAAPWAVDAGGRSVPTEYRVSGEILTQVVSPDDDAFYPIVADPWLGKNVIQSTKVIQRSSGPGVSVVPTAWGRAVALNQGITKITVYNAFGNEYKNRVAAKYRAQNMLWQLQCHIDFAPTKSSWNLDLNINRGSYAATVAHKCN